MCTLIQVGPTQAPATIPTFLPPRGWSIHRRGYLYWTSNATTPGIRRGEFAHRIIMEHLLGDPLPAGYHIHHQDGNKLNNCPLNLILLPAALNPSPAVQCPYTSQFITRDEAVRRGILKL